jgi:hypothetical protein
MMDFPNLLREVLRNSAVDLRLTAHGARLFGPGAAVTDELRAAAEEHRPRLTVLAKATRRAAKHGGTLAPCFGAWPTGDVEAGFLTAWFAAFGPQLEEEEPFPLPGTASTITDPKRFCQSVHSRLRRLQREELSELERTTLRDQLARLYERFGRRAEALPDPTGTRPPVVYSEDSEEAEAPRRPRRRESAGRGGPPGGASRAA